MLMQKRRKYKQIKKLTECVQCNEMKNRKKRKERQRKMSVFVSCVEHKYRMQANATKSPRIKNVNFHTML